jgi:hypothetical protein
MKTKQINDMYLVAALLSYGAELVKVDKENPNRQMFHFKDEAIKVWKLLNDDMVTRMEFADLDQVSLLFRSKRLIFLPNYHNFIKDVKSMIHAKEC